MSVEIIAKKDCDVKDIISRSPVRALPDAEKVLRKWLRTSDDVWVGMHDDQVACVWGLSSPTTISNKAYLWLLTTDLVDKHKFLFVRHSQLVVEIALKQYETITGHVVVGNDSARKWLRWLGAEISPPERGFSKFVIRRR